MNLYFSRRNVFLKAMTTEKPTLWQVRVTRREFLRKVVPGVLTAQGISLLAAAYPVLVEPNWLDVTRVRIPIPNLPEPLNGLRIVQFSDVHLGRYTREWYLRHLVRVLGDLRPDVLVFTGDMVTRGDGAITGWLRTFAGLQAPLGVWGVLGNHDHWTDADMVHTLIERHTPIRILRNENVQLEVEGVAFWLVGVDDAWVGADAPDIAFAGVPEDAFRLVLMHEPDAAEWLPFTPQTLQLSGHSHGGQVRLPLVGPPLLPYLGRRYDMGLFRVRGGWLYTNRGIGVITPPIRLNCRPEVTLFTLERA